MATFLEAARQAISRLQRRDSRVDLEELQQDCFAELWEAEVPLEVQDWIERQVGRIADRRRKSEVRRSIRERTGTTVSPIAAPPSASCPQSFEVREEISAVCDGELDRELLLESFGLHPRMLTFREILAENAGLRRSSAYAKRKSLEQRLEQRVSRLYG